MRKGKLKGLLILILVLIAATACGAVFAYMFKQTEDVENKFLPAEVSCVVHEDTDTDVTVKNSITVENTGNIDAYLRVRLVSYWVQLNADGEYEIVAKESVMPTFTVASEWIADTVNNIYYYKKPVAPGAFTDDLLEDTTPIILSKEEETGYLQVVEVFAEAIQSKPSDAVTESWNVSLDSDGNIISAP